MFEDKNTPQNTQPQTSSGQALAPMASSAQQAPVDMFDNQTVQAPDEQYEFEEAEEKPWYMQRRFIVLILAGILLLILVIFGVQFALQFFQPKVPNQTSQQLNQVQAPPVQETTTPQQNQQDTSQPQPIQEQQAQPTTQEQQNTAQQVTPAQPLDSDGDGLLDDEEKALGTDPAKIDSDADGLTDREEAKVFGSDPLKTDTDGDGYPDGTEVKNGYSPKGPGKLGPLPTEAQQVK